MAAIWVAVRRTDFRLDFMVQICLEVDVSMVGVQGLNVCPSRGLLLRAVNFDKIDSSVVGDCDG